MRINEILSEDQVDEISLGGVGQAIGKGVRGLAKGYGYVKGIPAALSAASQQGQAAAMANLGYGQFAQKPAPDKTAYDQELAKRLGQQTAAQNQQPAAIAKDIKTQAQSLRQQAQDLNKQADALDKQATTVAAQPTTKDELGRIEPSLTPSTTAQPATTNTPQTATKPAQTTSFAQPGTVSGVPAGYKMSIPTTNTAMPTNMQSGTRTTTQPPATATQPAAKTATKTGRSRDKTGKFARKTAAESLMHSKFLGRDI